MDPISFKPVNLDAPPKSLNNKGNIPSQIEFKSQPSMEAETIGSGILSPLFAEINVACPIVVP